MPASPTFGRVTPQLQGPSAIQDGPSSSKKIPGNAPVGTFIASRSESTLSEVNRYQPSVNGDNASVDDKENEGDVQDNINARVEQLFPTFTTSEFLLPEEMLELLNDLGLDVTLAALQAYSSDEQYDLETAQEIAQHFFVALRNVGMKQTESTTTVHLPLGAYIKTVLLCRRQRGTEYKVLLPKFELQLSPRKFLLGGTGVVMLLTGLLVIATISVLWVQTEEARERRVAASLGESVLSFSALFESNWLGIAGKEAASETDVFTQFTGRRSFLSEQRKLRKNEVFGRWAVSAFNRGYDENAHESEHIAAGSRLQAALTLERVFFSRSRSAAEVAAFRARLLAQARAWEANNWDAIVVSRADGSVLEDARTSCAAGEVGCSYDIPCVADGTPAVRLLESTVDTRRRAAQAASVFLPQSNIAICLLLAQSFMRGEGNAYILATKGHLSTTLAGFDIEASLVVALPNNVVGAPQLVWNVSRTLFPVAPCYTATDRSACRELDGATGSVIISRRVNTTTVVGRDGNLQLCSIVPTMYESAFVICSSRAAFVATSVKSMISVIDFLNFNFVRTTEIVAFALNRSTASPPVQRTSFRFAQQCLGQCGRSLPSAANAITAFETESSGFSITPDYRPQPVMGGFSYSKYVDMAIVIERDVHEIRGRTTETLVSILDNINSHMREVEILALRPAGFPPMKTFEPSDPCPAGVTCFEAPGLGVVYRSDCVHCERIADDSVRLLDVLTVPKDSVCAPQGTLNCSGEYIGTFDVYRKPFSYAEVPETQRDYTARVVAGYAREDVLAGAFYVDNISLGLVVQWPVETYERPILIVVGLSIGAACLFVLFALVMLMLQSRRFLDAIEEEWTTFKRQISEENDKFAETVVELLPSRIAQKLMKKTLVIAETQSLTHMFISFASFQRFIAGWEPPLLGQYVSYCFYLVSTVAQHYRIHKVRSIGDMAFIVGGVQDDRDGESMSKVTLRVVQAASVILQLTSFLYVHFPSKVAQLKTVAMTEKITDICSLRVGIHFGPCTLHVYQNGGTPNFDCIGPNVSMAWKLHQLAKAGTINVSAAVKEALERRDALGSFVFEKSRNVMHKKIVMQATIITHASVPVPHALMQSLSIRRSNPRIYFVEGGLGYVPADAKGGVRNSTGALTHSSAHQSERLSDKSD